MLIKRSSLKTNISSLTDLNQAARGTTKRSVGEVREEGQRESSPLDRLATKLGLPPNCDIDLRKQQELEVTDGVVSFGHCYCGVR